MPTYHLYTHNYRYIHYAYTLEQCLSYTKITKVWFSNNFCGLKARQTKAPKRKIRCAAALITLHRQPKGQNPVLFHLAFGHDTLEEMQVVDFEV